MSRLAALLLALALVPWPGGPETPLHPALRALESMWAARLFEPARMQMDAHSQLDHAARFARLSGNQLPYLFAAHQIGLDQTAPSRGVPAAFALDQAREARELLDGAAAWLPRPLEALKLHEFLLAQRILPLAGPAEALERSRMSRLLAAGGPGLQPDPAAYRAFLAASPEERKEAILGRLRLLGP